MHRLASMLQWIDQVKNGMSEGRLLILKEGTILVITEK